MSAPILAPRAAPPAPRSSPPRDPGRTRRAGARRARGPAPPDATGPSPSPSTVTASPSAPDPSGGSFIPGFLARVAECNEITPEDIVTYVPLRVAGVSVGLLTPDFADALCRAGAGVFEKTTVARAASSAYAASSSSSSPSSPGFLVDFDASGRFSADERTRLAAPVMAALRDAGVVTGWRDELFPVTRAYGEDALFLVERACASLLGIRAFGVHVNGFVTLPDGELELWVARRSRSKPTFPGKLDHLVAGGLPAGVAPGECVAKECAEEAGVSREWATRAVPVGTVSYNQNYEGCPKRDVLFCYDLELPPEFVPVAVDGEVESFERVPVREAMRMVAETRDFKANCCLVIVDFFVRRGLVTPEEPGYAELVRSLRQ